MTQFVQNGVNVIHDNSIIAYSMHQKSVIGIGGGGKRLLGEIKDYKKSVDLADIGNMVSSPTRVPEDKKDNSNWFVSGEFINIRTGEISKNRVETVDIKILNKQVVLIDIDGWGGTIEELFKTLEDEFREYNYVIYPSFNNGVNEGSKFCRVRLVLIANRPLISDPTNTNDIYTDVEYERIKDEYKYAVDGLIEYLCNKYPNFVESTDDNPGKVKYFIDSSSSKANQVFYYGSINTQSKVEPICVVKTDGIDFDFENYIENQRAKVASTNVSTKKCTKVTKGTKEIDLENIDDLSDVKRIDTSFNYGNNTDEDFYKDLLAIYFSDQGNYDYEPWRDAMFALKLEMGDDGLQIIQELSRGKKGYKSDEDIADQWEKCKSSNEDGKCKTIKSIISVAKNIDEKKYEAWKSRYRDQYDRLYAQSSNNALVELIKNLHNLSPTEQKEAKIEIWKNADQSALNKCYDNIKIAHETHKNIKEAFKLQEKLNKVTITTNEVTWGIKGRSFFKNAAEKVGGTIKSGWDEFDNVLGLSNAELVILAAGTSHGKTLIALNLAINIAKKNADIKVWFYSYEETSEELYFKALLMELQSMDGASAAEFLKSRSQQDLLVRATHLSLLKEYFRIGDEACNKTEEAVLEILKINNFNIGYVAGSLLEIDNLELDIKEKLAEYPNSIFFIDYVQILKPSSISSKSESPDQYIGGVLRNV